MTKQEEDQESADLINEIYDVSVLEHSIASKTEFKPWHHPRKHWVRLNQLCRLSRKLINESHFPDNIFRYLTLPGEELVDIQTLEKIAINGSEEILDVQAVEGIFNIPKGSDLKLKYIGFNNVGNDQARRATLELAKSTVNDSERIHLSSRIEPDLVQSIANKNSKSYKTVEINGPYNVINLDLCDSIAPPSSSDNTYFKALIELLELQRAHMSEPFLVLIATRTFPSDINKEALRIITEVYGSNLKDREFREVFEEMIEGQAEKLLEQITNGESVDQDSINRVFGVGIGKWLIHIMKPNAPFWDVTLEDICCYSIGTLEKGNMLSIAFKFSKVNQPINDKYGLVKQDVSEFPIIDEKKLALSMLAKSSEIVDVDDILSSNEEVREKLIKQSGDFLERSGYSKEGYLKWARSKF